MASNQHRRVSDSESDDRVPSGKALFTKLLVGAALAIFSFAVGRNSLDHDSTIRVAAEIEHLAAKSIEIATDVKHLEREHTQAQRDIAHLQAICGRCTQE